jgi:hypothetical protein
LGVQNLKNVQFSSFLKASKPSQLKDIDVSNSVWNYQFMHEVSKEGNQNLFTEKNVEEFIRYSKEMILREIRLTKNYVNINAHSNVFIPLTKLLNPSLISQIIETLRGITINSVESWIHFLHSGLLDSLSFLLQNYSISLEYEENNLFLFQEEKMEKKKYLKSCESHFQVLNQLLDFFNEITFPFTLESSDKQISIFQFWV